MNFFEITGLGLILILFPLYVYLFYVFYNVDIGKKDNDLLLDFALCSSFYLSIRYGSVLAQNEPIFLFNIVLLLAYIKKRSVCAILLSVCSIAYYTILFGFSLPMLLVEYLAFFFIYMLYNKEYIKNKAFSYIFMCLQILFISYYLYFSNIAEGIHTTEYLIPTLLVGCVFLLTTYGAKFLFESGESIIRYHNNVKQLQEEKTVRDSLFKITHEIKNPIAVCKGYLDMFDVQKKEHAKKFVPIIKKEIASTLLLLEDFLSMNKIKIEKEEMDVSLLLEEIAGHFHLLLHEKNIVGNFECIDDEVYIEGDYNRLMQVLINMVKNSIEALEERTDGVVRIYTEERNQTLAIIIEDNGVGITEQDMARIKEPFYSTKRRGTGLGVSLSDEIIEAHHGTLEYESEFGKGTRATIILPVLKVE